MDSSVSCFAPSMFDSQFLMGDIIIIIITI
jgi:hypothetical protein